MSQLARQERLSYERRILAAECEAQHRVNGVLEWLRKGVLHASYTPDALDGKAADIMRAVANRLEAAFDDYGDDRTRLCDEPTERGDQIAQQMRDYYEANKHAFKYVPGNADNLMLGLLCIAQVASHPLVQQPAVSGDGAWSIEGSIYEKMEACIVKDGRTYAHCWKYADAIEMLAALTASGMERMREALEAVEGAMLRGGDGAIGDFGWNITKLNKARPLIRTALQGGE